MRLIRRLDIFILKTFLPLFAMTFFIVLFIVLMQFLWKYVDDLVGKGLEFSVIAELFFYAAVCMVPMSLPLAILLASLMTFGNLGEKFELTAMKASGISLLRVMKPLIIFISCVAVGAFFFQNDALPRAQVKMWTLLFSMKQKSPEVEIPEGVFYDQIPGYNLYVDHKDKETGMLYKVKIYDVSDGAQKAAVILADSARLAFTKDMRHIYLRLYGGEQFENLREMDANDRNVPFRRETFKDKEVLIPFDANFTRMDDGQMRKQYVGKNIAELNQTIDSVSKRIDSVGDSYSRLLQVEEVAGIRPELDKKTHMPLPYKAVRMPSKPLSLEALADALNPEQRQALYASAISKSQRMRDDYEFKSAAMNDDRKSVRRHEIELMKKFTLSVACLIFFFIGAPLGAIIRKGGLGTPLVISVLLFLVYYIIDNTGYKMSRDGRWDVAFGMWLSTMILAPLGIYITIKAMNDASIFDKDRIRHLLRRLLCIRESRTATAKEVIMDEVDSAEAIAMMAEIRSLAEAMKPLASSKPSGYFAYWEKNRLRTMTRELGERLDRLAAYLSDSRRQEILKLIPSIPVAEDYFMLSPAQGYPKAGKIMAWIFPAGIAGFLLALPYLAATRKTIALALSCTARLEGLVVEAVEQ